MKWRAIVLCAFAFAIVMGGRAFAQTQLTFKGINYASTALKAIPIDKDHLVLMGEQLGVEINGQPAFNNMSTHFSLIVYFNKDTGWHFHGYGVYGDKDGDTTIWEIWDSPSGADGDKGKLIGATGKFAGMEGTCDFLNEHPRGWPENTGRLVCRENWNLTLKKPL